MVRDLGGGAVKGSVATPAQDAAVDAPVVVSLSDARALDPDLTGAKAANLARCAAAGLPVIAGFALTTVSFDPGDPGGWPESTDEALREHWERCGGDGTTFAVRSSSTVEDIGESSMAGQFVSVLGVRGWPDFVAAVRRVRRSSARAVPGLPPAPMAVLVQPQVFPRLGGVMFGLDPVTGDRQHLLVEVVPGGPEALVSGTVTAQRFLLGRRGRVIESPPTGEPPLLSRRDRARLARLAGRAGKEFGRAQDIEWAIDQDGSLRLLQTRPVTATGARPLQGPLLGPGPVGETFPDPLRPLEEDLWLPPLRRGIESALAITRAAPIARVTSSPLLVTVEGRVACDLEVLGASPRPPSAWRMLDPRVGVRRVISAWRIGRMQSVLPLLAEEMCQRVDQELTGLPPLTDLSTAEVFEVVQRAREYLMAVHGHEVLAGALLRDSPGGTGVGVATSVLRRGRELGLSDGEIVQRWPVVLALTPPRLGRPHPLPPTGPEAGDAQGRGREGVVQQAVGDLPAREALRLRVRWLQELTAQCVNILAERLAAEHRIPAERSILSLRLAELADVVAGWPAAGDLARRAWAPGPPLPSCFRMTADGAPVRIRFGGAHRPGGRGASQGRGQGPVVHDPALARAGDVLVTRTLDPRLAGWLPELGGIVAESGSALSHLAILAREYRTPLVVGVHDAMERYPVGSRILLDGSTGEVSLLDGPGGAV